MGRSPEIPIFFRSLLLVLTGLGALACQPAPPTYPSFPEEEKDYYRQDPIAGHLHQPHARRKMRWPEHPRQILEMRTNNLGFREDTDTAELKEPGVFRILVTGDSHTDGVVFNEESFANRLELFLGAANPGRPFEVLNGGAGYYGPFQYRRFFEREAGLSPDLVIVNVFMGNDFADACRELEEARGMRQARPEGYMPRLQEASGAIRSTIAQGLNQVYYFKTFPAMVEKAIDAGAEQLIGLRDAAEKKRIELLVSLQPSRMEIDRSPRMQERLAKAEKILGVRQEDLEVQERLHRGLVLRLEAAKVHLLDLYPSFQANPQGLFWDSDEHLSAKGHDRIANALCRELDAKLKLACKPPAETPQIFADGFESGDTSLWSATRQPP